MNSGANNTPVKPMLSGHVSSSIYNKFLCGAVNLLTGQKINLAADIYMQRFRLGETESPGPFAYLGKT